MQIASVFNASLRKPVVRQSLQRLATNFQHSDSFLRQGLPAKRSGFSVSKIFVPSLTTSKLRFSADADQGAVKEVSSTGKEVSIIGNALNTWWTNATNLTI